MTHKIDIDQMSFQPFDVTLTSTQYDIKLRPCSRKHMTWREELVIAASLYKKINKPKFLAMSGGIDSEVMAISFIEAGVEFTPFILKYEVNNCVINSHDTVYAEDFCKKHKIEPVIHVVDPNKIMDMVYDKNYFDYDEVVDIYHYIQLYIIDRVEELNGMAVLGSGIQMWRYHKDMLLLRFMSPYFNAFHYINSKNLCHWPSFFWTTPELIRSYIDTSIIKQAFLNPVQFRRRDMFERVKAGVYHSEFPNLIKRDKFHGYEMFDECVPRYKHWVDHELERGVRKTGIGYADVLKQLEISTQSGL